MRYLRILYVQVILGILLGIAVGHFFPGFTPTAKLLSDLFINMIRMVIVPIVFLTIVLGIAGAGDMGKVGRVGGKGLLYFEVVTTLALIIGLVVANWMSPGVGIQQAGADVTSAAQYAEKAKDFDWHAFVLHIVPNKIFKAFAECEMLQVLFFSVLFGAAVSRIGQTGFAVVRLFDMLSKVMFKVMNMIMKIAPIGAFAGMAYTIGKYDLTALIPLGKLMLGVYLTMALFIFVVLNLIARWYGFSLWKLLVYLKDEILIVLGTSSSESVLPNVMDKLESAGCRKSVVGLIIPTGYSFNLDGTTIYLSMAVIFLAQAYQIPLSIAQQLTLIGVLMITSKGAATVTGGGFIVLASTLSAIHVIPIEGLALLVGVDRFMSEARSITNLIGNSVATVVIAQSEKEIDWKVYREKVEGKI